MTHRALLLVWVAFGCGKSTKDVATNEARAAPTPTTAPHPNGKPAEQAPAQAGAPARGPERVAYSLVDNRLSAHLGRGGGLVVEAGSAGFAKYVRFNSATKDKRPWLLGKTQNDMKVARINGKTAFVYVPLTAAQAGRGTIRLRIYAGAAGALSLRVNDHKDINSKLADGWSTLDLAIPPGQLVAGENALQLFVKAPDVALQWLQLGATTPLDDATALAFADPAAGALVLPKDGDMSWYVLVPDKGRLVGDSPCALAVRAVAEDGAVAEGKLGTGTALELGALAGKAARIEVANPECPKATLANAAVVVPGAAPAVRQGEPPKYVVFLIMDSLRFDRVRAFNPKARPETPNFEKLAADSTLFMQHYVQGNESQVSHASIWSSTYLAKHKAAQMADKLADKWVTIDEVAKQAGKFTAGVSANGYIRPARGFGPAWDRFVNHIEKGGGLKGADVLGRGIGYITPNKDQPWFLYLGMIDTHVTWRAKQPWMDKYDGGYKGRFAKEFGDDGPEGGFPKDLTEAEKDHVRAIYDSNVSYQDDQLGKLRAQLEGWGVWDQTMLIITADHGDEQWEDGRVGHAASEQETLIHVPLVIHYPPLFPAAKIASGSEGIDIVPTLAAALGVAQDAEWQGVSLVPLANGAVVYPQLAMSSQYENFHGGRIGPWKLRLAGPNPPKLYNLATDPGEKRDVYASAPIPARVLVDAMWLLRTYNVEWKKAAWGTAAAVTARFAADLGE